LRNLDLSHPKLGLYKEVKTLETTLAAQAKAGEAPLVLNAFVLSPTKFADLLNVGDPTKKADLESRNVLFMEDGASAYLKKLFRCWRPPSSQLCALKDLEKTRHGPHRKSQIQHRGSLQGVLLHRPGLPA
jgi:hypothetical protein